MSTAPLDTASRATAAVGTAPPVLTLDNLTVTYAGRSTPAVRGIGLEVAAGQTLALVGESGSGKSTTAKALVGLLETATVTSAAHTVLGRDVSAATPTTWQRLRGTGIGYVPQDSGTGLNPVRTVGSQLAQVITSAAPVAAGGHGIFARGSVRGRRRDRVTEALEQVGLSAAHAQRYPHELSGGQRQRVLIALALVGKPQLVVADEPTSALDVTVQKQVLDLLGRRVSETGAGLVLITHDLGVAGDRSDAIAVMSQGQIVETGPARQVLDHPQQDYTQRLVSAAPSVALLHQGEHSETPLRLVARDEQPVAERPVVLQATGLTKEFGGSGRRGSTSGAVRAVDNVDLELRRGTTLGIVGESGSGKSTTAGILLGLEAADSGTVELLGEAPTAGRRGARAQARRLAQRARLVYQDPSASLDPRRSVGYTIAEPLRGFKTTDAAGRRARVRELLDLVALPESVTTARPDEISGGQRQRVAIARALAVNPELLVLDEPVSALDVSVQAQILDLLARLQQELELSYVFISHDLAVVREISDTVAVMAAGRVVEHGPAAEVFAHPEHPVTQRLLDAVPGSARLQAELVA